MLSDKIRIRLQRTKIQGDKVAAGLETPELEDLNIAPSSTIIEFKNTVLKEFRTVGARLTNLYYSPSKGKDKEDYVKLLDYNVGTGKCSSTPTTVTEFNGWDEKTSAKPASYIYNKNKDGKDEPQVASLEECQESCDERGESRDPAERCHAFHFVPDYRDPAGPE